jgi:hypothetical protein
LIPTQDHVPPPEQAVTLPVPVLTLAADSDVPISEMLMDTGCLMGKVIAPLVVAGLAVMIMALGAVWVVMAETRAMKKTATMATAANTRPTFNVLARLLNIFLSFSFQCFLLPHCENN